MMKKVQMFKEPTNRRDQNEIRITAIILLIAATASVITISVCMPLYGEPLEKDAPNANASEQVDLAINPEEILPTNNGTVTMDTTGINDIDINDLIPPGKTVILSNESVSITNHPVTIEELEVTQEQAPEAIQDEIEEDED